MYPRTFRSAHPASAAVLAVLAASPIQDAIADVEISGSVGVGTDYAFRGISQTMGSPAVEASLDAEWSSGFYAYAWGSNVDFIPEGGADDGATYELDLAYGYATELAGKLSADLRIVHYVFPGTNRNVDYNYDEFIVSLWYNEKYRATLAYSDNVDGTEAKSLFYELAADFELPRSLTLHAALGRYDLSDAYGSAYSYLKGSLCRSVGNAEIELAFIGTSRSAVAIYGDRPARSRAVLSVRFDF